MLRLISILFGLAPWVYVFSWFRSDDQLISKEGWDILNDPVKRVKLREYINHYHKTGEWDNNIMN